MNDEIKKLKALIIPAAREELLPRFARVDRQQKLDGSFVTEADLQIQQRIITGLSEQWPDTVILAEEMSPGEQADIFHSDQAFWCLDPLDGTSNFAAGIPYFAVSICLIQRGEPVLGLVYDPVRDECFVATKNSAAMLNDRELSLKKQVVSLQQSSAIIDFKRLPEDLAIRLVTEKPYASQRNFGASALDWCWLAAGRGHIYLHGKQNLWDYGAGQLILSQAGGYSCSFDHQPVFINQLTPRSVIAATDETLFTAWKNWIYMAGDLQS